MKHGVKMAHFDDEMDEETERPEFHATIVSLMDVTPGNYDHAEGEEALIVTTMKNDLSVENMAFSLDDARVLVTKSLISLAINDALAQKLLDDHFSVDDGNFVWPREP